MNRNLLIQVRDTIAQRPGQFLMRTFFSHQTEQQNPAAECGTACCIAGWAITLKGEFATPMDAYDHYNESSSSNLWYAGRYALDLTDEQASRLFEAGNWPAPFSGQFHHAQSDEETAAIAVKRIDHFLANEC